MIFTLPPVGVEATTNNDHHLGYDIPSELQPLAVGDLSWWPVTYIPPQFPGGMAGLYHKWIGTVTVKIHPHYWSSWDSDLSEYGNFIVAYEWFNDGFNYYGFDPDYDGQLVELLKWLGYYNVEGIINRFHQRNIVEFKYYEA